MNKFDELRFGATIKRTLLIVRKMNKSQLKDVAYISTNAAAKSGKNEKASMETVEKYVLH